MLKTLELAIRKTLYVNWYWTVKYDFDCLLQTEIRITLQDNRSYAPNQFKYFFVQLFGLQDARTYTYQSIITTIRINNMIHIGPASSRPLCFIIIGK